MTIVQDLYNIYDKELARYRARRSSQGRLLIEIRHNLAFLREGLRERLPQAAIVAGLEDEQYRAAAREGLNLGALQKRRLAAATYGGVREFARYRDWPTARLIENAYERIATLKKLASSDSGVDLEARLKNLFKFMMVLLAHLEGRQLPLTRDA
jgi:hypothetical protein